MLEIKASLGKEAELNVKIEDAEDQGKVGTGTAKVLRALVPRVIDDAWNLRIDGSATQ
jgi:hypothetical protein